MNLENLNVVELKAHEMQNTDGGVLRIILTLLPKITESYHNGERVGN